MFVRNLLKCESLAHCTHRSSLGSEWSAHTCRYFSVLTWALGAATAMNPVVLSYNNCLLRRADVALLEPPNWFNDQVMAFAFEYMELEEFVGMPNNQKLCFIGPEVSHFIKFSPDEEIGVVLGPLDLQQKDFVFLAINDHASPNTSGGTHWSLLLYDRATDTFRHYDSSQGSCNSTQALHTARRLKLFLGRDESLNPIFSEKVETPQQENAYDCGMYVLCHARLLAREFMLGRVGPTLNEIITPSYVTQQRRELRQLIDKLAKQNHIASN
ncbi:unnamed protein product [Lampetra planeri]